MAKLSSAELAKREDVIQKMKKNKRSLVKRYGPDAEKVMYGRATNIAKKVAESEMEKSNLKELVRAALMKEKAGFSKEYDDNPALKGGQKNLPDGLQKSIIDKSANEDLDLGHQDNEPHMLKGDLYRIGKYAMELYQMVDEFEGQGEVDFPHWWQAKIINAREAIESAKHYLDFETKEPEIDAMVGAIDMSGALDNIGVEDESLDEALSPLSYFVIAIASLIANPITGRLIIGLFEYLFSDLPQQRAEAKELKSYRGPDKQEKVLALAKEVESKLSLGKKRYLKSLINAIGKAKLEDEARAYRELDRYATGAERELDDMSDPNYAKRQKELSDYRKRKHAEKVAKVNKAMYSNKDGLDENLNADIEVALEDLPVPTNMEEGNLGHNELASLEKEGGSWIVTYRTMDGKKEKVFTDEDEARAFMNTTLEEGLPKGYWSKKIEGGVDESFEKLVGKLKKGGKSEKAAKAIAGAVANYKAKGGGKGPTAKQKARG